MSFTDQQTADAVAAGMHGNIVDRLTDIDAGPALGEAAATAASAAGRRMSEAAGTAVGRMSVKLGETLPPDVPIAIDFDMTQISEATVKAASDAFLRGVLVGMALQQAAPLAPGVRADDDSWETSDGATLAYVQGHLAIDGATTALDADDVARLRRALDGGA